MKARSGIMMPLLAVVIGVGMIVSAAVLSNILVYTNQVQGITLTSTWTDGAKSLGQEYAFSVGFVSPAGAPSATITFDINGTGITPSAITVQYFTGTAWTNVNLAQNGPNDVVGTSMVIPSGSTGGYDHKLTYNAPGTYILKIWAA